MDMDRRTDIGCAELDALKYAWRQLEHHPYDGGGCKVGFDAVHNPERRQGYSGFRSASTEEGYSNLTISVYRDGYWEREPGGDGSYNTSWIIIDDAWIVDVETDSRDCDSRYTGGRSVRFQGGFVPERNDQETRDHTAEAAGY